MIFLNYEKAQGIFDCDDPLAIQVATHVNAFMISEEMRYEHPFLPCKPFDMCYFYYSVVRAVGSFLGRTVCTGLEADYKILAFNKPDLREEAWMAFPFVSLGLASLYVSQVEADSQAGGLDFDLGFACAVACRALTAQRIAAMQSGPLCLPANDFDSWLAGFNTPSEEKTEKG
jgi:hypothetical protein